METLFPLILIVCAIFGYFNGLKVMKETKEGKRPGVVRDNEGHTTYIFYDMD